MILNEQLVQQINEDIKLCDNHKSIKGSETLYNELVAKYTVLDSNFKNGLPTMGKITVPGEEFDFKPELRAISAKLKMILMTGEKNQTEKQNPQLLKLHEYIEWGKKIKEEENHPAKDGFPDSFIAGEQFNQWMSEINILNERYLKNHPLYNSIHTAFFHKDTRSNSYDDMMGYLKALERDTEFWEDVVGLQTEKHKDFSGRKEITKQMSNKKVFIVHGHDELAESQMARFIEKIGLQAIILHEQPNSGRTIIEKIEANSDVQYAVVLYTPCDVGRTKEETGAERYRARQNVVFEHGYLIGKLGRDKVSALVKGDVETPGDISGVVYIKMDDGGAWKTQLVKEMMNIGLECDINKIF